jgi:Sec-independent protein translocase protein TatA
MPSISFGEILMILLVVIIFVKPEEMPKFMRTVAKTYRKVQRLFFRVRNVTQDALREVSSVGLEEEWQEANKRSIKPPPAELPAAEQPTATTPAASAATPDAPASEGAETVAPASPPDKPLAATRPTIPTAPPADGPVPRS